MPPAQMMMHPGPGVDGPGPGVMVYQPPAPAMETASQLEFRSPVEGMEVRWDVTAPGRFDSEPLVLPARYSFPQGAIYRLKLSNIAGRPGVELYPTVEVAAAVPRSEAFLAHSAVPIQFTEEDFDQVLSGNFVTKVIYLPNPEYQELALAGVEELVSTRLEPGKDPIIEASHRGAILAVIRLGNKDLQLPSAAPSGDGNSDGVTATGYHCPLPCPMAAGAMGVAPMGAGPYPYGPPMGYVAGVTGPQYGMPMCGTPIGLPGPPHVPLGVPAGLQSHTIVNHTKVCLPEPTHKMRIDVKEKPGYCYPQPPDHICIVERTTRPGRAPCATPCAEGQSPCSDEPPCPEPAAACPEPGCQR
jgi:hypothetical protein